MNRISTINPDRIFWCCNDRGITPEQLADDVTIAAGTMAGVLNGTEGLTFLQLRRIAEYFNRGVLFFLEKGDVSDEQVYTPQFRTIANQKPHLSADLKALIERVERQRDVYLSLREDLGEDYGSFDPPSLPTKPEEAAPIVRTWLGLNTQSTFDEYRSAVEGKGILVFRSNGYAGKWQISKKSPVAGFTLFDETCPIIFVRKAAFEARQTFTMMHELGHVLLHRTSFIDEIDDLFSYFGKERDANAFAGRLLVPDEYVEKIDMAAHPADVEDFGAWLRPYRKAWGASNEVILRRLLDESLISHATYEEYRRWGAQQPVGSSDSGSREWRHREPKHIFGETFVRTVLDALQAGRITLARASTYLDNLKVRDIHKLEGHYAGL